MPGNPFQSTRTLLLRRAAVGALSAALLIGFVAVEAVGAQEDPYNPDPPRISVADNEVCEGDSVVITVSGVDAGTTVTVTFAGQSTTITAGSDGTASTSFGTGGTGPGAFTATATAGGASSSAGVTVLDDETCNPGPPPRLSIADPSVCQGASTVATVTGTPGTTVTITLAGQSSTVTIGDSGSASASFSTAGLAPGEYSLVASNGGESDSAPLFVLGSDAEECAPDTPNANLSVSASDTCVNQPVVVSVTGAAAGEAVTVSLSGQVANVTAGSDGAVQASVPSRGLSAGSQQVLATSASGAGASTSITLQAGGACADGNVQGSSGTRPTPDSSRGGVLAITGGTVLPLAATGAAFLGIGAALVWRSRRKNA